MNPDYALGKNGMETGWFHKSVSHRRRFLVRAIIKVMCPFTF